MSLKIVDLNIFLSFNFYIILFVWMYYLQKMGRDD